MFPSPAMSGVFSVQITLPHAGGKKLIKITLMGDGKVIRKGDGVSVRGKSLTLHHCNAK